MKQLLKFFSALLLVFSFSGVHAAPSEKDAQTLVEKAGAYVKANGKDKFLAEVMNKSPEWNNTELYVFAYDLSGTLVADPNPKMVGKNMYDVPDVDGKLFRKEIIDGAKSKGNGWVDYRFKNPSTGTIDAKTAFFLKVADIVLVAGIYKK